MQPKFQIQLDYLKKRIMNDIGDDSLKSQIIQPHTKLIQKSAMRKPYRRFSRYRLRQSQKKQLKLQAPLDIQIIAAQNQPQAMSICQMEAPLIYCKQTPDKCIVEHEELSTRSSSYSVETYEEKRQQVMLWLQATASDEFLSRHTYTLAAEYLDQFYSHPQTSREVRDINELQAVASACLGLAAKLDESYRVGLDRLSKLASVEKSFIIAKEMELAIKLSYRLFRNSYSRVIDEWLYRWDQSNLNLKGEYFFREDVESYQRYRNIFYIMDDNNISQRITNVEETLGCCLIKILGDTVAVRQFTGYIGPPMNKYKMKEFPRHDNCEHNLIYTDYLRLQTFTY